MTYSPIDRLEITSGDGDPDEAESRVRVFLGDRATLHADPHGVYESSGAEMEATRLDVIAALRDLDWIEGFLRGIADGTAQQEVSRQSGPA